MSKELTPFNEAKRYVADCPKTMTWCGMQLNMENVLEDVPPRLHHLYIAGYGFVGRCWTDGNKPEFVSGWRGLMAAHGGLPRFNRFGESSKRPSAGSTETGGEAR